ncbi:glycosyltransferase family 2 protein [Candidatus Uhrbacteria bacterium]|nr:glycosyltransferase family 2 protein [Candidatus Uhrbacteria bacterium]
MDISIIIVNYHAKGLVRECVKSVIRSAPKCSYEIIVVDNGCESGLAELLKSRFPSVVYVGLKKNYGFSGGVNAGIALATGTYILVSNMDITVLPGSLDTLYGYMEKNPDIGIVGPRLLNPDRTVQQSYYRFHTLMTPVYRRLASSSWIPGSTQNLSHFLMKDCDVSEGMDVDWLLGAALFVRRSSLNKVGLMDSKRFFLYFEDTDWCRRFWQKGYRVRYVPQATMIHLYGRDSAKKKGLFALLEKATRTHIASGMKYFLKYRDDGTKRP